MIQLFTLNLIRYLIYGNNYSWFLNINLTYETFQTGVRYDFLISMLEKLNLFYLTSLITLVPLTWKWMYLFLKKNHLLRCWDWASYIISIAETASNKIGALIWYMKFLSPEVALYLYKFATRPCMEPCCHVWARTPSWNLDMLYELQ